MWKLSALCSAIVLVAAVQTDSAPAWPVQGPITVVASTSGRFLAADSWYASINSAGQGQLTILDPGGEKTAAFDVSQEQLEALRDLLEETRFFELDEDAYGELVSDGSEETLTIVAGFQAKTVRIRYLMNWVHSDPEKLREPARALRVWTAVRGWFEHPEAVNLQKYHQMVLDAAAELD